ncbi:MAG: hypothetical protein Q9207_005642 [Kuettlingeria erythrocarpa]
MSPLIKNKSTYRAFAFSLIVAFPILILIGFAYQRTSSSDYKPNHESITPTQVDLDAFHEHLPVASCETHAKSSGRHGHHRFRRAAEIQDSTPISTDTAVPDSSTPVLARHSPHDKSEQDRNRTAEYHLLTKRANPDPRADLNHYTCKGQRYLAENIQAAKPNPPKWTFDDLDRNGWEVEPGDLGTFGIELQRALSALGIPTEKEKSFQINANLVKSFKNKNGAETEPQAGEYETRYIPPEDNTPGTIISTYAFSPKYYADLYLGSEDHPLEGDALESAVPPMNSWADIVWGIWAHTAGSSSKAGDLRYIFHDNITTDITKKLIEMIEGVKEEDERSLELPWPGRTYAVDSQQGLTLLGSPHGVGVSWLYWNGRAVLGARKEIKVTIFSSPQPVEPPRSPTGFYNYYMAWDLGPRS